ncbi:MAG: radical SAM protein [Planctomycetota bacterium]|nr:radical SAM protein [Planctomycetota bacterium]
MPSLVINEIYRTIAGEGSCAGLACTIVRLTGCNLRCTWCDTSYAYDDGREMSIDEVLGDVKRLGEDMVLVTGGEPLLQGATPALIERLCDAGCKVLLETNGSLDIDCVDPRVMRCVDIKCPGSGQGSSFRRDNLDCLRKTDEIKFILTGRDDYEFARELIEKYDLTSRCTVFMNPAAGLLEPAELAEWILADSMKTRLGLQLHKIIWPEVKRGV